jgi:flotillin
MLSMPFLVLIIVAVILAFSILTAALSRYRRCPSDKLLVIYGKIGKGPGGEPRSAKCIHGGASFVWPVIQDFQYLDLKPMTIEIDLKSALSRQNIRINVPSVFTVAISTEEGDMINAAVRLLGLGSQQIKDLAADIILGQLRQVIATMDIEEINADREKFLANVTHSVGAELRKIGLKLINVNVKDLVDESGYIAALGKKAAAQAINQAKKEVAEQERDGEIGKANAEQERRIKVSAADASAVKGENEAKITIANSEADRREKEADAERRASAAEKIAAANALREAYEAEKEAELKRADRVRATQKADMIVPAEINKERIQIEADARAEQLRREAKGTGDASYLKMEGEARGIFEVLNKQAEGFKKVVEAAGKDPKAGAMLMIVDKLPEIVKMQVQAISNIKLDKVLVWDSNGASKDGAPAAANFLSGMLKSLPPLKDLLDLGGMNLPEFLGKEKQEETASSEKESVKNKQEKEEKSESKTEIISKKKS